MGPLGTNFSEILIKIKKTFIHETAFENTVCEMAAILSKRRLVNSWQWCVIQAPGISRVIQHYSDVIMGTIASQITSLAIVYSTVYSDADQRKHQSSASPAFVRGIHRGPVNSPHKWPVTRKMFPFDDVIVRFPSDDFRVNYVYRASQLGIVCYREVR